MYTLTYTPGKISINYEPTPRQPSYNTTSTTVYTPPIRVPTLMTVINCGCMAARAQSIGSDTTEEFTRVRGWLLGRLNAFGRRRNASGSSTLPLPLGVSQWQRGCPEIIPGGLFRSYYRLITVQLVVQYNNRWILTPWLHILCISIYL